MVRLGQGFGLQGSRAVLVGNAGGRQVLFFAFVDHGLNVFRFDAVEKMLEGCHFGTDLRLLGFLPANQRGVQQLAYLLGQPG